MTISSAEQEAVQKLVAKGCMILPLQAHGIRFDAPTLSSVGYLELWPDKEMLFFAEVAGDDTGHQHTIEFDRLEIQENQANFYLGEDLVAGLAPYIEWPDLDYQWAMGCWQDWTSGAYENYFKKIKEIALTMHQT